MPIDTKDSYKYRNEVRVKVDSTTEEGKHLLETYKKDQKYHYMDIGRVGRHMPNGKYYIEKPIIVELIRVPKIIRQVREKAVDKAGKDVYELKTFLSRFGELDFYATIDYNRADLYFVEHVWVENLGIQENYSTLIYSIFYENKQVPMKEIFYKFNISANADDYGKRWKDIDITNTLIAKTKATLAMACANTVAKSITQAALDLSVDTMEENSLGKKVINTFNKAIKKDDDLKFNITKTPELTKTNLFLDAIDNVAGNKELRNAEFVDSINKVLDIQTDKANIITADILKATTPLNICNKFTELQESSIATIEGAIDVQFTDAEMLDGMRTSRTVLQVMPDGTKKVVLLLEPTDPLIENFDIKNESLVTQIRIMNSDFDNIMTIDGQPVDISVGRFDEESMKTRAYLVLQGMQQDERFDIYSIEDEKEFKKKIKRLTVQEAEEMKRLRAQYREVFAAVYDGQTNTNVLVRDLDQRVFVGQLEKGEGPVNYKGFMGPESQKLGEERLRTETERLRPIEEIQAAAEDLKEAIVLKEREETEEEKEKKKLVRRAQELNAEDEKAILERQQEQAEELQEEVIEAQQRGEDIEKHLENIEKHKAETQQTQESPHKKEDQEAIDARNKLVEDQKNQLLMTEKEKELAAIAEQQLKEEEERKRRQTQQQLDLEAMEQMEEDELEDMIEDDSNNYTSVEQDNINSSGSEVFESEHQSEFVHQDSEGVAVISSEPVNEISLEQ